MKLTDAEKRNIVSLIEKGEFLPDEYRFKLFDSKNEIELLWDGKSNETTNTSLPFQIIEHVDEPREDKIELQGNLFDDKGRQLRGWTNKLIWGNNSLVLSSLINGPLRNEIENNGGLKLVYIDPPFNVGDDFEFDIEVGKQRLHKKRNALEKLAFSDTWGKGADSFLSMFYERIKLIKNLMSNDGSIYVHCDWRLNSAIRFILDEVFGEKNFQNEIIWHYVKGASPPNRYGKKYNSIFFYSKTENYTFNLKDVSIPYNPETIARAKRGDPRYSKSAAELEKMGKNPGDVWTDINPLQGNSVEYLKYPTQKPEKLLERIILGSSNEGDLVGDFFCGSGTTLAVAEKLNRKWIGSDLGKFAIHASRKRLINIQREKKEANKNFRAFEVLNLGKYQREFFFKDYLSNSRSIKNVKSEEYYYNIILEAYKAQPVENLTTLKGVKTNRFVAIGPFNLQVTRLFVQKVIEECLEKKITQVDVLGFEFEMGLFPNIREVASKKGIDLNCLYIPNEVFDKNAIKKNQIIFYNTAYINAEIIHKKNDYQIKLKGYAIFDSDSLFEETLEGLSLGEKRELYLNDSIIKIHKDKQGKITKNIVKMKWSDWIDYWAVDFDFESKKETIIEDGKTMTTGDFIFENEWQSFRSKDNNLEFVTPLRKIEKGKKVAIKVIDIFGNDTMKIFEL